MTTAATVFGHLPLVFATGPGAGARNSIGIMLVTGMIIGTCFTLFVVPSIFVLVARTHKRAVFVEAEAAGEIETVTAEWPGEILLSLFWVVWHGWCRHAVDS